MRKGLVSLVVGLGLMYTHTVVAADMVRYEHEMYLAAADTSDSNAKAGKHSGKHHGKHHGTHHGKHHAKKDKAKEPVKANEHHAAKHHAGKHHGKHHARHHHAHKHHATHHAKHQHPTYRRHEGRDVSNWSEPRLERVERNLPMNQIPDHR